MIDVGYKFMKLASNNLGYIQIQKLCYYAYGIHYSLFKESLFDEDFIKHDHGPYNIDLNQEMHHLQKTSRNLETILDRKIPFRM
jgi:uncharacterized phage-associated protein